MTNEDVKKYLETVGQRGLKTLDVIQKLQPFVDALQTELGMAFLKDDLEDHARLMNKIYDQLLDKGTAEQQDVVHLKLLHARLDKTYAKLKYYADLKGQVMSVKTRKA
jgi:hypothetical protein